VGHIVLTTEANGAKHHRGVNQADLIFRRCHGHGVRNRLAAATTTTTAATFATVATTATTIEQAALAATFAATAAAILAAVATIEQTAMATIFAVAFAAATIAGALARAAVTTGAAMATMTGNGLVFNAHQGDADDREKDRDPKHYESIHPKILQYLQVP
jgi:hypothetical protein